MDRTQQAIMRYGEAECREAYRMHTEDGCGDSTVGWEMGLHGGRCGDEETCQYDYCRIRGANHAIHAGRVLECEHNWITWGPITGSQADRCTARWMHIMTCLVCDALKVSK